MALTQDHIQHILNGYNKENIRYVIDEVSTSEWYLGITNNRTTFTNEAKWMVFKLLSTGTTVDTFTAGFEFEYVWDDRLTLTYIDPYAMNFTPINNSQIELNAQVNDVLGSMVTLGGVAPFTYTLEQNDYGIFGISGSDLILALIPPVKETTATCKIKTTDSNGIEYFNDIEYIYTVKGLSDEYSIKCNGVDEQGSLNLFNSIKPLMANYATNPVTMSGWFKFDDDTTADNNYNFIMGATGANNATPAFALKKNLKKLILKVSPTGTSVDDIEFVSTNDVIVKDTWYHIAATGNIVTETYKVYLNGVEIPMTQTSSIQTTYEWGVNAAYFGGGYIMRELGGYFNEIAMFTSELTASNITEIYSNGAPGDLSNKSFSSDLMFWWRGGEFMRQDYIYLSLYWVLPSQGSLGTFLNCTNMTEIANKSTDVPS